jgi:membrane dipeptidase
VLVLVAVVVVVVLMHASTVPAWPYDAGFVILDGHNDYAARAWEGNLRGQIDLATAHEAGWAGGFFALSAPSPPTELPAGREYALPPAPAVPREEAKRAVEAQLAVLEGLDVSIVRRASDFAEDRVNAIVHLEGAEPLDPGLSDLEGWYERGLRSIGIVWSRPNAFGEGVPFRFPSSPDIGGGLTRAGRDLVHACNITGILVDLSHLNEAGFWDVARISQAPLVATHSNAHALCPISRNLTDRQFDAIGESGGVVGINFGTAFLEGEDGAGTPGIADIVRHVDYVASRIGIDHVAFGSDFEGTEIPSDLGGVSGLPWLVDAIRDRGYGDEEIAKITHGNWLRVLDDAWRPWSRYFRQASLDARETLLAAVDAFPAPGEAVDLGAGTGRDTLELLRRGWRVVAIDMEAVAIERIAELAGAGRDRLDGRVGRYEKVEWPEVDLVNASFSLPFCPPEAFPAVWSRIVGSLRGGGRFAGQFFGPNDDWARTGLRTWTRVQVESLLAPFEVEMLDEHDRDGWVFTKPKHWHVFHVVARKV